MERVFEAGGGGAAALLAWVRDGMARAIIRARVPPNALTLAGPVAMAFVFIPLLRGDAWTAGWLVLVAVSFDSLDGAVARRSREVTRFGAYLDSVVDRYADLLLLFALLVYLLEFLDPAARSTWLAAWCVALVGTVGTSYARARAEKLIPGCAVGFFERPERVVAVIVGLLASNLHLALLVSAVFTNLIAAQRILYTRAVLEGREPTGRFAYWDYPRGSAPHAALSFAIFLLLVFGHHLMPRPF